MKKTRDNDQMALAGTEEAEILGRLSERVEKAVGTIQELRRERDQLRARVQELEARMKDQDEAATRLDTLEEEHDRLKRERGEIRDRIENILGSLEALE
ncbi:MAG TPA: cell division protein ZapB [Thermoanaerobaculia bacterium]|jgi:FtsZ-binding cell division protein ZapB|nr:cell division protein ZapB [Thermoanaerobaculia bacterium]